jgi:hypothetical protein
LLAIASAITATMDPYENREICRVGWALDIEEKAIF